MTRIKKDIPVEATLEGMPWAIFKLKDQDYAINSNIISSIGIMPEEVTSIPEAQSYFKGVVKLRGEVIPVLDLRKLLGITSLDEEFVEFKKMLDSRKQDHINWVATLKKSIDDNTEFTLATDPHKCAFGKWYDNFKTDNNAVAYHMKKIDEPHTKLHQSAIVASGCGNEHDKCNKDECLQTKVKREAEEYMTIVVSLIEEAKEVMEHSYRGMLITLDNGKQKIGVTADDIVGVEPLYPRDSYSISKMNNMDFIEALASRKDQEDLIMQIGAEKIFNIGEEIKSR